MSIKTQGTLAILGGFTHEGITTTLSSIGFKPLELNLTRVKPHTWQGRAKKLRELSDNGTLAGAAMYLHTHLFLRAAHLDYRDAFFQIVEEMKKVKSLIFVFQDNLEGIFARRNRETGEPWTLTELQTAADKSESFRAQSALSAAEEAERLGESLICFTEQLMNCGIDIAPFYVRTDVIPAGHSNCMDAGNAC